MPVFEASQVVPRPAEEVFAFFQDPANLLKVSPPELHLRLTEPLARLRLGARVTAQGRRWGVPLRTVSEVTAWDPPKTFTDVQVEGPFRKWVHTHVFEAVPEGTRVTDRIEYEAPGGLLGLVARPPMIERDLKWVFAYRTQKLAELLGT
jgi:ligand-binding SRPBCC domain-containing protein